MKYVATTLTYAKRLGQTALGAIALCSASAWADVPEGWRAADIDVTKSRPAYIRGLGYVTQNTLTANEDTEGALRLTVTQSSHDVLNADGTDSLGMPYFDVASVEEATRIEFALKRARFNYTAVVYEELPEVFTTTLTGLVTDNPIPFATVSVTVNGQTFTTVADENGFYSLDIATTALDALVLIEAAAENPETGAPINLVNLAGSFQKTLEEDGTNVTNVTSAKFTLMLEANGGEAPTNTEELRAAETSVDATELIELSAVIKLVLDNPEFDLPEGFDSVLDFIADEGAVDTFIEEVAAVDPDALANTVTEILNDSDLVAGFTADSIPEKYLSVPVANPGFLARDGSLINFNADNTGVSQTFPGFRGEYQNTPFSWAVVDGALEMTFTDPQVSVGFEWIVDIRDYTDDEALIARFEAAGGYNGNQVEVQYANVAQRLTLVNDGELVDIVVNETRSEITVQPFELNDGTIMELPVRVVIGSANQTLRNGNALPGIPFTQSCEEGEVCALGRWSGYFHYSPGEGIVFPWQAEQFPDGNPYPETAFDEVMTFHADNTVTGIISERTANWSIDELGRMVITYDNGMVQTVQLLDNKGIEYGTLSTFVNGDINFATYSIFVRGDDTFEFTPQNVLLPDTYSWNSDLNNWIPGQLLENGERDPARLFGWQFLEDGSGFNLWGSDFNDQDGDGIRDLALVTTPLQGYEVQSDRLRFDRYTWEYRNWFPVASVEVDGVTTIYVIERAFRDESIYYGPESGRGFKLFIPPRLNIEVSTPPWDGWPFYVENPAQ